MDHTEPAPILCPWNSPGKNTRVGCLLEKGCPRAWEYVDIKIYGLVQLVFMQYTYVNLPQGRKWNWKQILKSS